MHATSSKNHLSFHYCMLIIKIELKDYDKWLVFNVLIVLRVRYLFNITILSLLGMLILNSWIFFCILKGGIPLLTCYDLIKYIDLQLLTGVEINID